MLTAKKLLFSTLALGAMLTSCSSDENLIEGNGTDLVTFSVNVPDMLESRAGFGENSSSAMGGITNVDMTRYDLRYQLAVFSEDGEMVVAPKMKVVDSYQPVTYDFRLTPNRNYQVVVWADFVNQGSTTDLHYSTADLQNITCLDDLATSLNDESRDAYFITKAFATTAENANQSLTLKRPFAKLRFVTTDWNMEGLEMPDNFKVEYYGGKRFTGINALTGAATSEDLAATADGTKVYTGAINKAQKEYALSYDAADNNRTLFVDYLMTDLTEQTPIHLSFEALDGEKSIARHDLKTNVPIKRNWLTTIIGNSLSVGSKFEIKIQEEFENEWIVAGEWWNPQGLNIVEPRYNAATKTYHVSTRDEFAWFAAVDTAATSAAGRTVQNAEKLAGKTISIDADIDMSGIDWQPIYTQGETTYTVLGNGHTLRNFSLNGKFGAIYEYKLSTITLGTYNAYTGIWGKFEGTMKDLTFENITINGRSDDATHVDLEGNPVDHSKETAYFAGVIGYTGANYSTKVNISNITVRHIDIDAAAKTTTQNVGGFIGWIGIGGGDTWIDNCHVQFATLHGGNQIGGLVGQVKSGRYVGIKNCSANNITIHRANKYYSGSTTVSGFIGQINEGNGMEIFKCAEPQNITYKLETGEVVNDYTPKSPFYGNCSKNVGNIKFTPIEDTPAGDTPAE